MMKRRCEIILFIVLIAVVVLSYQQYRIAKVVAEKKEFLKTETHKLEQTLAFLDEGNKNLLKDNEDEKRRLNECSAEIQRLEAEEQALRQKVGEAKTVKDALDKLEDELHKTEESFKRVEGEK